MSSKQVKLPAGYQLDVGMDIRHPAAWGFLRFVRKDVQGSRIKPVPLPNRFTPPDTSQYSPDRCR